MNPNMKLFEELTVLAAIGPSAQAVGTLNSGWVLVDEVESFLASIQTGVLGAAATLDAKLQQATNAAGAGAKDITGKALTQIVKATGDNVQAFINCRGDELDVSGGFCYVQLSMTVAAAASQTAAVLYGGHPRNYPASDKNPASVVQLVG
jgi:hypothetical protein